MNTIHSVSTGRKGEIDFVKGITILSVVIGHLVTFDGQVFKWIFGFHMPVFFLLYGFMLKERQMPFPRFVVKQAKRLLVPTWIYRLIYSVMIIMMIEKTELTGSMLLFNVFWDASLEWFLPVMFWVTIGMYVYMLAYRKMENEKAFALFSVLFITVITSCCSLYRPGHHDTRHIPFKLDSGALALSFAIIGFWLQKWDVVSVCMTAWHSVSRKALRFTAWVGMMGIYTFLVFYNSYDNYVNMADNVLGNSTLVYYVAGTMMFLMLIVMGKLMNDPRNGIIRWIHLLGRHSMLIYLGHELINRGITEVIKNYTDGMLVLTPMINLNVTWGVVFFVINMTLLTGICLLKEKMKPIRGK